MVNGAQQIADDQFVASIVNCQRTIDFLNRHLNLFDWYAEFCQSRDDLVFKRQGRGHRTRAHFVSDRAALHIENRVVAVFAFRRCRQTKNILRLYLLHDLFKGKC